MNHTTAEEKNTSAENEQNDQTKQEKPKKPKKPRKPKKKNRRLLIQVSLITFLLFFLATLVISMASISGSFYLYFKIKSASMQNDFTSMENCLDYVGLQDAVYEYWSDNIEKIQNSFSNNTVVSDQEFYSFFEEHADPETNKINFESCTEEEKYMLTQYLYQQMIYTASAQIMNNDYHVFFVIDVSKEHCGELYVNWEYELSESPENYYEYVKQFEIFNNVLENEQTCNSTYGKSSFELEAKDDGIWIEGCLPIYHDGKLKALMVTEYLCHDFFTLQEESLIVMLVGGILTLVTTNILIVMFIYGKVTRPISKIKKSMLIYKENKDSKVVERKMKKIRVRNEIGVLADSFTEMTSEISDYMEENLRLTAEKEKAAAELELASNIQSDMLPRKIPASDRFELFASMTPAKEVGGDFYDYFKIDEDHLCLVIADVSGKGVPAALFMMMSKLLIKDIAKTGCSPAEIFRRANNEICENNKNMMFVTVWLGILEISTGKITAVNAGHEFPVFRQPGERFELMKDKHGVALGLRKNMKFTEYEFTLQSGGSIFVYTDGVAEATNSAEELYGTDRLLEVLNRSPDDDPKKLIGTLLTAIDEFVGDAPQFDDLTVLCLKYKEPDQKDHKEE